MKKSVVFALAFAAFVTAEAKKLDMEKLNAMTPEARQAFLENRRMKITGGFMILRDHQAGKCAFVNAQTKLGDDYFKPHIDKIANVVMCEVTLEKGGGEVCCKTAKDALAKTGANAAVFIVDNDWMPPALIAQEECWAIFNVGALRKDTPKDDVLRKRIERETWRIFARLCGASDSMSAHCVMQPVTSLKELDDLKVDCFSPEAFERINKHLRAIGIKPYERITYRSACERGIAPAPTNDFQKAIWDQIHSIPENPIKIKYDSKRDK